MRFVIVSFIFLFWAFYELSGGADFEPRHRKTAPAPAPEAKATHAPARPMAAARTPAAETAPDTADRGMGRPAIARPMSREPAPLPETTRAEPPEPAPGTAQPEPAPRGLPRIGGGAGLTLLPGADAGGAITFAAPEGGVPSLATITQGPATRPPPRTRTAGPDAMSHGAEPEIREIIGTRVTMRSGPGTIYPAIARLAMGRKVKVLEDSGTGWLRLQTLRSGLRGWVAASLVSKPAR